MITARVKQNKGEIKTRAERKKLTLGEREKLIALINENMPMGLLELKEALEEEIKRRGLK